jgi:hypothetical protein
MTVFAYPAKTQVEVNETWDNHAKSILAQRKLQSVLKSNPDLANSVYQFFVDSKALSIEAAEIVKDRDNLKKRGAYLRNLIEAKYASDRESRQRAERLENDYIQQQNWNILNNEIRDLGTTIQNTSRGGATVVVPR